MFIIILNYTKPLEQVDEVTPSHREFLKKYYESSQLICSGRRNPRVGGVIVANMATLESVWTLIKEDPFYLHGVAEYEVIEFTPTLFDERFACFLQ